MLALRKITITIDISIHALLAESDFVGVAEGADTGYISIHALLAESDGPKQPKRQ